MVYIIMVINESHLLLGIAKTIPPYVNATIKRAHLLFGSVPQ